MSESTEVQMGRFDERLKNVERVMQGVDKKLDSIFKSIDEFHEHADNKYATKDDINEIRRQITRNLIASNLLTATATAIFIFLLQFFLTHQ